MSSTQTDRFSARDLFNQLAGQEFGDHKLLEQAVVSMFDDHLTDFPPGYTYRNAIDWAERQGWLFSHPKLGLLVVSMHRSRLIKKPTIQDNRVDVLLALVKELQEKCDHNFKLTEEIRLQESRVENVWIEPNAGQRMNLGRALSVELVTWKCAHCSVEKSGDYLLFCPFCGSRLEASDLLVASIDFKRYFESVATISQDELYLWRCVSCEAGFIRPRR